MLNGFLTAFLPIYVCDDLNRCLSVLWLQGLLVFYSVPEEDCKHLYDKEPLIRIFTCKGILSLYAEIYSLRYFFFLHNKQYY